MKYFLSLIPWLLLLAPCLSAGAEAGNFAAQFESLHVRSLVDQTPGGALVIVERGQVVMQRTYGVTQSGGQEPVTDATLFRIASLSKSFAAAAASILVRDTSVTWQTPLKAHLAHLEFKEPALGEQINLRHIMSQTTGLMPHAYTNLIEENMSYPKILSRLNRVDHVCPPGRCYGYQNVVFSLVGDLVESQTSLDYPSFVRRELFEPLDMSRASFGHKPYVEDTNRARPHVWNGKRWRTVRATDHYYKVPPAAGVNASLSDMTTWLLAQLGQRPAVLNDDLLEEMHRGIIRTSRYKAHYPKRPKLGDVYYGLGWRVFDYGAQQGFVHHGGYVRGMTSSMVFHRPSQTGMVLLTNAEPRGINELVLDFADMHDTFQLAERARQSGFGED